MLIGFSVSNFRSFNSPQSISFKPSKIARHKKHLCEIAGKKVLKSAVIYGANAGGKSNLIKAIDFSRNIILNGVDSASLSKMNFRISSETFTIPGTFQYQLIAGEYEYSYGIAISYSKSEIISEWLVRIDKNKNMTMYYGAGKYYKVRVLDNYGRIAKKVTVKFTLNGKTYYKKTNSKGIASIKIRLNPKTYTVSATYKGFTVKNKIKVIPLITKNISKNKVKTIKFTAKLVNSKGKILRNKLITFKLGAIKYKRKTNSKGIATVSLKNLKKGKYYIYSTYGKLTVKNTIKII